MKQKSNTPLVLVGVGALALLAMSSKGQGDGSESGGIQIPFLSPQSAGADPSGGSPVYNITFPEFAGFPTGDTGSAAGTTKKEWNPAWGATPSWADPTSNVYNPVRAERGFGILEASGGKPVPIAGLKSLKKQPVATSKLTPFLQNFGDTNQKSSFSDYLKTTNIYGKKIPGSSVGSQRLASPLINTGLVKSGSSSSAPMAAPTKKSGTIITGGSKTPFTRVVRR